MTGENRAGLPRLRITRRGLLQGLGLAALQSQLTACQVLLPLTRTRSFEVIRPEDRLWLRFDLYNLDLDPSAPSGQPRLIRKDPGEAYVVVAFPPQSVAEEALPAKQQPDGTEVPIDLNQLARRDGFAARLAGESRLAFRVPDSVTSIPYTLEALLDWTVLEPSLVPVTSGPSLLGGAPTIRAPFATESALELPWWLVLSPEPDSRWAHAVTPVTHNGRTELWHTRLGRSGPNGVDETGNSGLRAVWAMDPELPSWLRGTPVSKPDPAGGEVVGYPFVMSARPVDRLNAVRNTSDWSRLGGASTWQWKAVGYRPTPFSARMLHLTALGATADLDGQWDPPQDLSSLVAWAHRMFGGRDSTVRVVNRGFLYPWGHRAVQIDLTERRFLTISGARSACLLKRRFLVINERRRAYEGAKGVPYEARSFPFREVEILTRQTPDVISKTDLGTSAYQPLVENSLPMMVDCVGTDWVGRRTAFKAPFVFVSGELSVFDPSVMGTIAQLFQGLPAANRTATVGGARVAFAKEEKPDDTTLELHDFLLGAETVVQEVQKAALEAANQIAGFPAMVEATVKQVGMQAVAGAQDLTSKLKFPTDYLTEGFGPKNAGGVFLEYVQQKALQAATDATGGLITPNQALTAVTRALGPVGGKLADAIADKYDPKEIFDQFGKLLGGVPLKEILSAVEGVKNKVDEAIKWVEQRQPTEVVASFKFKPKKLHADSFGIFQPDRPEPTSAVFEGEFRQSLKDPNARSAKASGELTNFELNLVGSDPFLVLAIDAVRFRSGTGKKTELDVKVRSIRFAGALAFVEQLRPFLEALGQGPSSLPIPRGIEVTAGLQIPRVQMGVFQLANLGFDAKLVVPFTGDPVRFRFRFATKENPFTLSIAIFGGTGYFALGVGGDGVELVEIAFEFGGMLALDVGVASGSIKAVAGVYIKVVRQMNGDRVELTGYLKLTGQLSILGIVSVSILLDLSFQYLHKPLPTGALDIITGRAKCEIKVTIVFFTISVGFEVEKSFGGNPADPTVADQFEQLDWQEYAAAFA